MNKIQIPNINLVILVFLNCNKFLICSIEKPKVFLINLESNIKNEKITELFKAHRKTITNFKWVNTEIKINRFINVFNKI